MTVLLPPLRSGSAGSSTTFLRRSSVTSTRPPGPTHTPSVSSKPESTNSCTNVGSGAAAPPCAGGAAAILYCRSFGGSFIVTRTLIRPGLRLQNRTSQS